MGENKNQFGLDNDIPAEEQEVRILILAKNKNVIQKTGDFLNRRGWPTFVTDNLADAIPHIVQEHPHFVVLSMSHNSPKVAKLPMLLTQTFNSTSIAFSEDGSTETMRKIQNSRSRLEINGNLSGPNLQRAILKLIKETQDYEVKSSESANENSNEKQFDMINVKGGKNQKVKSKAKKSEMIDLRDSDKMDKESSSKNKQGISSKNSSDSSNKFGKNNSDSNLDKKTNQTNLEDKSNGSISRDGLTEQERVNKLMEFMDSDEFKNINTPNKVDKNIFSSNGLCGTEEESAEDLDNENPDDVNKLNNKIKNQTKEDLKDKKYQTGNKKNNYIKASEKSIEKQYGEGIETDTVENVSELEFANANADKEEDSLSQEERLAEEDKQKELSEKLEAVRKRRFDPSERKSFNEEKIEGEKPKRILLRAATEALKKSCSSKNLKELEKINKVDTLEILTINSSNISGYLALFTFEKNDSRDDLMLDFRASLIQELTFLTKDTISVDTFLTGHIEPVNLIGFGDDKAEFVIINSNKEKEVAVAFFQSDEPIESRYSSFKGMAKVKIKDLIENKPVNFNAFLRMDKNDKFFKYINPGRSISEKQKIRLLKNNFDLHIKSKDVDKFKSYVVENFINDLINNYRKADAA